MWQRNETENSVSFLFCWFFDKKQTGYDVCSKTMGGLLNSKTAEGATIYHTAVAYPVGIVFAAVMLALLIHATKKAGVRKAA